MHNNRKIYKYVIYYIVIENITICDKMTLRLLVRKLELADNKFIAREEIKLYCKKLKLDYYTAIRYLTSNKYLTRILRGIFYIKSIEERKLKKVDINYIDALKEALRIKGVKWYFGLESAIKLNNLTHEYFTIETVITDSMFRPRPLEILGVKVKFVKISKDLFHFGLIGKDVKHSDIEKTLLDMIYLGKYNNYSEEIIRNKISDLLENSEKSKLMKYSEYYPKTIIKFLQKLI